MGTSLSKVVWFDPKVFNQENQAYYEKLKEKMNVERYDDLQLTNEYIRSQPEVNIIVISCGSKGQDLMKLIHSLQNVSKIFIFTSNQELHKEWIKGYSKIQYMGIRYSGIEEKVREAVNQNNACLALGANQENAILQQVVNHNIGNQVNNGNIVRTQGQYIIQKNIEENSRISIMYCYKHLGKITKEQVCEELCKLKPSVATHINRIIIESPDYSNKLFEGIIHLYTTNYIYQELKKACFSSQICELQFTLTVCFTEIKNKTNLLLPSSEIQKLLYRGVKEKLNGQQNGFWSAFTSTSTDIKVAKGFASSHGTVFKIKLSSNTPHPHASISKLSQFPSEKEVLLLPFFPLKEISREQEGNLTYINVEQDPSAEVFTLDIKKGEQFWDNNFFKKLRESIEQVVNKFTTQAQQEVNIYTILQSEDFDAIYNESFEKFHLKNRAEIADSFWRFFDFGAGLRSYQRQIQEDIQKEVPQVFKDKILTQLSTLMDQLAKDLKKTITEQVNSYYNKQHPIKIQKIFDNLNKEIQRIERIQIKGILAGIFLFLGESWDGMVKPEKELKVLVKDKIKKLIDSGIIQNKSEIDAQSRSIIQNFTIQALHLQKKVLESVKEVFSK